MKIKRRRRIFKARGHEGSLEEGLPKKDFKKKRDSQREKRRKRILPPFQLSSFFPLYVFNTCKIAQNLWGKLLPFKVFFQMNCKVRKRWKKEREFERKRRKRRKRSLWELSSSSSLSSLSFFPKEDSFCDLRISRATWCFLWSHRRNSCLTDSSPSEDKSKKKGKQKAERIVHTEQCSRSMTEARRKNKIFLQEYKDLLWHCVAGVGGFESTIAKKNLFDFLSFFSFQLSPQVQRSL